MNHLENAIPLDAHLVSEYPQCRDLTEALFETVLKTLNNNKKIRNQSRFKEALKLVIINLWISYETGRPIKYSRARGSYTSAKRYGRLHFKYGRLLPIIDTLERLGFIRQYKGFFDRSKNFKRQTRMEPTDKLIALFYDNILEKTGVVAKSQPQEIVQLKKKNKELVDYVDTRSIRDMRTNLVRYNEFIEKQTIRVDARPEVEVNAKFLLDLWRDILKGVVKLVTVDLIDGHIDRTMNGPALNYGDALAAVPVRPYNSNISKDMIIITNKYNIEYNNYILSMQTDSVEYHYQTDIYKHNSNINTPTMTNYMYLYTTMTRILTSIKDEKTRHYRLLRKTPLADFGFERLAFNSRYQYLHRVFNDESFKLGGRFYGAYHLAMPKELRKCLLINGEPTVELDFSALHIRMLYHLAGIDYRDDPYAVLCDNDNNEERGVYKLVQLIAINAENRKKAVKGIRNRLRKNRIFDGLTNEAIIARIERFKKVHPDIAKYLNTGMGLKLQNLDSRITDIVLRRFTLAGIPCLPVHDSYIVPERYKDLLRDVMTEAYQKIMKGFRPVIK